MGSSAQSSWLRPSLHKQEITHPPLCGLTCNWGNHGEPQLRTWQEGQNLLLMIRMVCNQVIDARLCHVHLYPPMELPKTLNSYSMPFFSPF